MLARRHNNNPHHTTRRPPHTYTAGSTTTYQMWHSRSIRQVNVLLLLSSVLLAATAGLEQQQEQQQQQLQGSAISLRSTVVKRPGNTTETSPKCKVTGPKSLVPPGIFRCKPSTGVGRPVATAGPAKGRNGGWQLSEEYCYNLDVRLVRAIAAVVVGSGRSGNGGEFCKLNRRSTPIVIEQVEGIANAGVDSRGVEGAGGVGT